MIILTQKSLTTEELNQIHDIVNESRCINESLKNTFPNRFSAIRGNAIFFDTDGVPDTVAHGFCYIIERR